jgi:hypothetical protein
VLFTFLALSSTYSPRICIHYSGLIPTWGALAMAVGCSSWEGGPRDSEPTILTVSKRNIKYSRRKPDHPLNGLTLRRYNQTGHLMATTITAPHKHDFNEEISTVCQRPSIALLAICLRREEYRGSNWTMQQQRSTQTGLKKIVTKRIGVKLQCCHLLHAGGPSGKPRHNKSR